MANKGYYNEKNLEKFRAALAEAVEAVKTGTDLRVRISDHNSKMGAVASVSTPPFLSCPASCAGTCGVSCYAAKLAAMRPSVLRAYAINMAIAILRPDVYWSAIDAACKAVRFFRFHVSGDIINAEYFRRMIETAEQNPGTQILCFTKRFEIVNAWMDENGALPSNLHILFSGWTNLVPENPHSLPETNVIQRGEAPEAGWTVCPGNCFDCAITGRGCWAAGRGDTIAFHIH